MKFMQYIMVFKYFKHVEMCKVFILTFDLLWKLF